MGVRLSGMLKAWRKGEIIAVSEGGSAMILASQNQSELLEIFRFGNETMDSQEVQAGLKINI